MPDIKVSKDENGHYHIVHPTGMVQVMAPEHAQALGVKGLFDSHVAVSQKPLKMSDGGYVPGTSPELDAAFAQAQAEQAASKPSTAMLNPDFQPSFVPVTQSRVATPLAGLDQRMAAVSAPAAPDTAPTGRLVADNGPGQQFDAPGSGEVEPAVPPPVAQNPMFAPPQMMQTGVDIQAGKALPAANKRELGNAMQAQMGAVDQKANVEADKSKEISNVYEQTIKNQQAADDGAAKAEQARQAQINAQMAKYQSAVDDYMKTPNQTYWEKQGTSGRIMGGIAMALGAMGSAYTKGPNYAMEIINKAIDDDLNQQKLDMEKKGQAVRGQEGILAQMRLKFGDDRQAEIAAKTAMLKQAELQMQGLSAKYQGPEAQANAQATKAGFQAQYAELGAKMAVESAPTVVSHNQLMSAPGANPENRVKLPDRYDKDGNLMPGSGGYGLLSSKDDRKDVIEHNQEYSKMKGQLAQLGAVLSKGSSLSPSDRSEAALLSAALNQNFVKYQGFNRFTDNEKELFQKAMLPDSPGSFSDKATINRKLQVLNHLVDNDHDNLLSARSVMPIGNAGSPAGLPMDPSRLPGAKMVRVGVRK